MTKSYSPHIMIIEEALTAIERYRPARREEFLANDLVQDVIHMRLQVIGEQLSRIRKIDENRFAKIAAPDW